jgi:hypothetical protein
MARHVLLRELLIGIEGVALLRHLYDGTNDAADQRLAEVRRPGYGPRTDPDYVRLIGRSSFTVRR